MKTSEGTTNLWRPTPSDSAMSDDEVAVKLSKQQCGPCAAAERVDTILNDFRALDKGIAAVDARSESTFQHADLLLQLAKIERISTQLKTQLSLDDKIRFNTFDESIDICKAIRDFRMRAFAFANDRSKAVSKQDDNQSTDPKSDDGFWGDKDLVSSFEAICTRLSQIFDKVSALAAERTRQSIASVEGSVLGSHNSETTVNALRP